MAYIGFYRIFSFVHGTETVWSTGEPTSSPTDGTPIQTSRTVLLKRYHIPSVCNVNSNHTPLQLDAGDMYKVDTTSGNVLIILSKRPGAQHIIEHAKGIGTLTVASHDGGIDGIQSIHVSQGACILLTCLDNMWTLRDSTVDITQFGQSVVASCVKFSLSLDGTVGPISRVGSIIDNGSRRPFEISIRNGLYDLNITDQSNRPLYYDSIKVTDGVLQLPPVSETATCYIVER